MINTIKKTIKKQWRQSVASIIILTMLSGSLISCSHQMGITDTITGSRSPKIESVSKDNTVLVNKIAANIRAKKAAGYLAQVPAALYNMPAYPESNSAADQDISVGDKLDEFYSEPEPVLTDIGNEEKGTEKLELLDAIYAEETMDVVAEKAGQIDPKAQEQLETELNKMVENNTESQQAAISQYT